MLLIDLPLRFILALISFTFRGWIGWSGIVLGLLKIIGVIHWQWWVAALPLEYGVLYCLYMTIDGALYRAGKKGVGGYARFTTTDKQLALGEMEQVIRNVKRQRERYSDEQLALAEMEHAVRDLERKKTPEEKERTMGSVQPPPLQPQTTIGHFKFYCPHCGQHISTTRDAIGTEAVCPTCQNALTVPSPIA
jgi:hypothetical protein